MFNKYQRLLAAWFAGGTSTDRRPTLPPFCAEALERRFLLSTTPVILYSFTGGSDGNEPAGIAVDSAGDVYGTTYVGGNNAVGAIFELPNGSTTVTEIYSFTGGTDGSTPGNITINSSGDIFGTAFSGGAHAEGTIWELPKGASAVTTLYAFTGGASGDEPVGITSDAQGDLFGTAYSGGAHADGTIWELAQGSSTITTLYSFTGGSNGGEPDGITIDSAGNLFGTDYTANSIWELPKGSSGITTLYTFNVAGGAYPEGIAVDNAGNLYGTTGAAGANGIGNVWELASGSTAVTSLYSFTAGTDGDDPTALTIDSLGDLYGTTYEGGVNGGGVIYEMTDIGDETTPLALTTPSTAATVDVGGTYTIDWTGGSPTDTVQLWAEGGPANSWTELTAGVPESAGSFTWNTTGVDHGWYYFQAWDIPTSGSSYAVQSPNYLHIVDPDASVPNVALTNPALAGDATAQDDSYTLNFSAADGTGDTNPIYVQLWVYSGNSGQWTELPNANYLPASQGSYVLNTSGMAPGWYSFSAHATNGDQWSYASSPGWLNVTVPTPTITFTTPTSDQSVVAGGTFNLDWNIAGLSSSDLSSSTVQIWAQHLVDGSPVWTEVTASVSASGGTYTWTVPTSPGSGTYYAFSIWLNDGNMWWDQASPNWLQVT